MDPFSIFAGILALLILVGLFVMAILVYRDARKSDARYPLLWGGLTFISGIFGVFLYIAVEKLDLLRRSQE